MVEINESESGEYTIDAASYDVGATESSQSKNYPKQLFATMELNHTDVSFQLDSGATCNLLLLKEYFKVMGDPENLYLKERNAVIK